MTIQDVLNLAMQRHSDGHLADAESLYRQILEQFPNQAETAQVHYSLGLLLQERKDFPSAIEQYKQALALHPDEVATLNNLGVALTRAGLLDEAIVYLSRAASLRPDSAEVQHNLAGVLNLNGRHKQAIECLQRVLALAPQHPTVHVDLSNVLYADGQFDAAEDLLRQAIALRPNDPLLCNNLANIFKATGRLDEAIEFYGKAKDHPIVASNRIFALHLHSDYDAHTIRVEEEKWDRQFAQPLRSAWREHTNDRSPDRPLRIGYVSHDFRQHVVGWNILPLLKYHDPSLIEIYCYADVARPDDLTQVMRSQVNVWRDIYGTDDAGAADLVRSDRIDILVDLSLHSAGNRLLLFARKPAPVQVSYLGYAGGTSMEAMDYRLSDPYLDPSEEDLAAYREKTVRLPRTYWCYQPGGPTPPVEPAPSASAGYITFGCLSTFAKVTNSVLDLWAQVLKAVPKSHLLLNCPIGSTRRRVCDRFAASGISSDRIEFVEHQIWERYLHTYDRIDISLDPFPYGGAITVCDSLWMGVPVISLSGRTAVGRSGRSILRNVALFELAAFSPEEYVALACDCDRLVQLRPTLRDRMLVSPLCDAPQFARDVEAAFRQMWKNWLCLK